MNSFNQQTNDSKNGETREPEPEKCALCATKGRGYKFPLADIETIIGFCLAVNQNDVINSGGHTFCLICQNLMRHTAQSINLANTAVTALWDSMILLHDRIPPSDEGLDTHFSKKLRQECKLFTAR